MRLLIQVFACLLCLTESQAQSPFASGTNLHLISDQFKFTEGPAADRKGNVYFTDQPNDKIWIYTTKGKLKLFKEKSGRSNGLYFDLEGRLIACADEHNQLWRFDRKGSHTVLADGFEGKLFNGPNDVWVDKHGGMYFTDPYYQRDYWNRGPEEQASRALYYLDPKGNVHLASRGFVSPNGLIGNSENNLLYVADIGDQKTYVFDILPDGSLQNQRLFCEMGSDGMTMDHKGNVYLTGKGVTVFNPAGEKIGHLDVPQNWTANVTFGGKNFSTLFITAMNSLYQIEMDVHGQR